jgi:16S rRNA (guanine966-N2)-methyltransferase
MRIIAGEFRGRRLLPPVGEGTRPITDRAKQSLFDILAPHVEAARVYDCFAGTGSMGLEALSRGAAQVVFFESDRSAATRLRQNIDTLRVRDRSTVVTLDIFRWFAGARDTRNEIQLIFLDPPYRFLRERPEKLQELARQIAEHHLAADGLVIFRHDAHDQLYLPPLRRIDSRRYGDMEIELLAR